MHRKLSNQFRNMLRRKELTARLTGISRIVGNQELVSIPEQVNLMLVKVTEL